MIYPLNQSQLGIYYASKSQEPDCNYTISCLFDLHQDIDLERLRRAIEAAVMNHPHLLDTVVVNDEGDPMFERQEQAVYHLDITQATDIETLMSQFAQDLPFEAGMLMDNYLVHTPKQDYLCLHIHHILMDGCGLEVLLQDISAAYDGKELMPETTDAIAMNQVEQAKRQSPAYQEEKTWYEQTFGGVEGVSLPLKDVYTEGEHGYVTERHELSAIDSGQVAALAAREKMGISIPYTAAFAWTLHAFTGDEDISYATFFHGRKKDQMGAVTMMVRTMPITHAMGSLTTVKELLSQTHDMIQNVRSKDSVGFGEVCGMSGFNGDVGFIYQGRITDSALMLGGQPYHWQYLSKHEPGLRLNVQIQEHGDHQLEMVIGYPKHEYSQEWIQEFVSSFEHILGQLCEVENLSDITPAGEAQCQRLDGLMPHGLPQHEGKGETMISLWHQSVAKYGERTAFHYEDVTYTYRELDELTDRIAARIRSMVTPVQDSPLPPVVSILIPRNEWMILAPLAALKAGCAYQPLDPSYPAERLNFMVHDSQAALVITTEELRPILSEYEGAVLMADNGAPSDSPCRGEEGGEAEGLRGGEAEGLRGGEAEGLRGREDRLFILLYTSGSTGKPKGVMLSHKNVISYVRFVIREWEYSPEIRSAAYASFGFDANLMDMYPTLVAGGMLNIIPDAIRLDLNAIGDYVEKNQITHMVMTTQVGQQFATTYDKIGCLRCLGMGGEKMVSMPLPSGYKIYNLYGPTECSVAVTYKHVTHNEVNIPIGRATDDVQLYVVDKHLHRLPIGAPGELIAVGTQVGMGYLNLPDKTAQAFVDFQGQRAYRTGDIVRFRNDGDIEFVGRKDGQVKIRGFRIELKEIESVIREYEGISDVTVQAFDYEGGGKYIVAYIVGNQPIDITALNAFIADQKPPYMVPAYTMQLEKIPLNVNQKVDKKALPKPEANNAECKIQNAELDGARLNILEEEIKQMIVDCTHQEDFTLTTPLIYAGLTSISAMKLGAKLYKRFGVNLDAKAMVKSYSMQDIENAVLSVFLAPSESPCRGEEGREAEGLRGREVEGLRGGEAEGLRGREAEGMRGGEGGEVPLTGAQQGIYLDWETHREALQYNVPLALRLDRNTDLKHLTQALQSVVHAHPALQVHLEQQNGEVMMVKQEGEMQLYQHTVDHALTPQDLQAYMQPFDLMTGPLYRMTCITEPEGLWLIMDIHHIVYDGLSTAILLRDLDLAYQGKELIRETYSLLDYAHDEQALRQSEQYTQSQQYFDALIDDIEATHYPESEGLESGCQGVGHVSTSTARATIEQACHQLGITANSYMASVVSEVLHRITREKKVLFTTISNGRNDMRVMDTIGMFVQTLVVVDEQKAGRIGERMQAMHHQLQQTLDHDNYPFSEIASRHHITPQVLYAFQDGVMDSEVNICGQNAPLYALGIEQAKAPISVQVKGNTTDFVFEIEYDKSLYGDQEMEQLSRLLATLAGQFVQSEALPQSMAMIPSDEAASILNRSYGGDMDYDHTRTLPHWVQYYAEHQPQHPAVVDFCGQLTYSELDDRSNLLGQILRAKGVSKDTLVGVMLPRVKEFLLSVIAIQKAGGAYVPMDSEYPNDRLLYMLEDSESRVLITTHELFELKSREGNFDVPQVIYIEDIDWTQPAQTINLAETDGLAYMIYTSGSTGRPKGTMLEHRNLMAFAGWRTRVHFEYGPEHNFLCYPSFCFDASICDLLLPVFAGSCVHILHEDLRKDLDGIAAYIEQHHIDSASMPTQLGMALINAHELSLKYLEMGGEKLVQTTPRSFQKVNGYGPTEFACCSSYHQVSDDETDIPIGRPAPNSWSVIVDSTGNIMPWGMAGEICLIGEQMSRGYWHQPEKTAAVFTPCPFMPGRNMYHTGDLARYNDNGELVYLGRIDHQVKLRGFRIEMGEIEAQMASYPDVTGSIALVQDISGTKHLVGYYTASKAIDSAQMKVHLQASLTAYMVPDALVQMEAFPLTPNGKIDRKQLPIPAIERSVEYMAPRNELEEKLCHIFEQIIGVDPVGIQDDFFEIGGTSLLAIKAVIDITNLGKPIVYGDLFRLKTPQAIAAHLDPSLATEQEQDSYYRFHDYDYSGIERLLSDNHLPEQEMKTRSLGNVLLAGATGFMGIHVLDYLVRTTDSTIYCLIRPRGQYSGESRLKTMMVYYLTDTHSALIGSRIRIIEDDITNAHLAEALQDIHVDTIFNCAAMVKHFVVGKEMDKVNVEGVDNLVRVAEQQHACLIHVSTYSTAGYVPNEYRLPYTEQQLYIGQCTDNEYIRTKFLSERIVLQAVADGRIQGKVMRVGNLMAREQDGEFQINIHANAFLNNLRSLKSLGLITSDLMATPLEMSPIDCVAQAIGLLATTPNEMVLFHPYNNYRICRSILTEEMDKLGYPIRLATPTQFKQQLDAAMQDDTRSDQMQGIIHYTTNIAKGLYPLGADNFYTTQVLMWLGFTWPMTTNDYIRSLLDKLDGLAYFD